MRNGKTSSPSAPPRRIPPRELRPCSASMPIVPVPCPELSTRLVHCLDQHLEAIYTPESMTRRLQNPGYYARGVVTVSEYVVAGGKTMFGTLALHLIKLLHVKLVIPNHAPIVRC